MKTKRPVNIMLFGVITRDGAMLQFNFLQTHHENVYQKHGGGSDCWIERVATGKHYVWQQDSVPCHIRRKT